MAYAYVMGVSNSISPYDMDSRYTYLFLTRVLHSLLAQAAGDSANKEAHSKVDDAAMKFQLDSAELTRLLETATGDAGVCNSFPYQEGVGIYTYMLARLRGEGGLFGLHTSAN